MLTSDDATMHLNFYDQRDVIHAFIFRVHAIESKVDTLIKNRSDVIKQDQRS